VRKCLLIVLITYTNFILAIDKYDNTVVYSNKPINNNSVQSNNKYEIYNYRKSQTILFDILLDENITNEDPRLKSIIYVVKNSNSLINIIYSNTNATELANRLAQILSISGIKVIKPSQINASSIDSKSVGVIINYKQSLNKKFEASNNVKQKNLVEEK